VRTATQCVRRRLHDELDWLDGSTMQQELSGIFTSDAELVLSALASRARQTEKWRSWPAAESTEPL